MLVLTFEHKPTIKSTTFFILSYFFLKFHKMIENKGKDKLFKLPKVDFCIDMILYTHEHNRSIKKNTFNLF